MARDTGKTAVTTSLAPAIDPAKRHSIVIMYRPVYQSGITPTSISERRATIRGYVYAAIDLNKLFDTALHDNKRGIRLTVLEGSGTTPAEPLYDSAPSSTASTSGMVQASSMEIGGKFWALQLEHLPEFHANVDRDKPGIVLVAGLLVSVLLFVITWFLINARRNAIALVGRMTTALREQESFSRSVVDTAADAIIVIDGNGAIQSFNQAAEKIFGYVPAEVINQNVRMLMPSPDREQHDSYLAHYLTTSERKIIGIGGREVTGLRKNGETFPMELSISEIVRYGQRAFTGIVRDITERKRADQTILNLNKDLLKRAEDLTGANQELEAFSYSVSHDLRAPLRHIGGYIGMIKDDADTLDEQTRHRLDIIDASAGRMGTLIDDLLAFSRLGRSEIRKQDVDLTAVAKQVITELQSEYAGREIFWKAGEIPSVWGDPSLLKYALTNLIANAIKFTRSHSLATIKIGAAPGNGNTTVFVEDNGIGFDMAYVDKLFRVFQRLHAADEFEGTGIGLANVHRIISRHGGKVWAKSEPGAGATFYFSLPNKPPADKL